MATRQHLQAVPAQQEDDMIETIKKSFPLIMMEQTQLRLLAGQQMNLTLQIKALEADRNEINREVKDLKEKLEALAETMMNATKPVECNETMDWRHNKVVITPLDGSFPPYERTMTTEEAQRTIPTGEPAAEDLEDLPEGEEPEETEVE